jgi:hypothetical protein
MPEQSITAPPIFKAIPGFPTYRVSQCGTRVETSRRHGAKLGSIGPWRPMVLQISSGYPCVILRDAHGRQCGRCIHRLVLEAFVGPCPEGMECCHNDGNPLNNSLENLRWDTHKANMEDQLRHGSRAFCRGEQVHAAKLKESDVIEIHRLLAEKVTRSRIAQKYGVSSGTIYLIATGKNWRHLAPKGGVS